jgi:hypothetical protein
MRLVDRARRCLEISMVRILVASLLTALALRFSSGAQEGATSAEALEEQIWELRLQAWSPS